MDQRQSNTKGRIFSSAITFDWLTYLENRKEPAQEYTKTYILKKISFIDYVKTKMSWTNARPCHFRASLTSLIFKKYNINKYGKITLH